MSDFQPLPDDGESLLSAQKSLMRISGGKSRLRWIFEFSIVILLGVSCLSYWQISDYMSFVKKISQADDLHSQVLQLKMALKETEMHHSEFMQTQSSLSAEKYNAAQGRVLAQWNNLDKLAKLSDIKIIAADELPKLITDRLDTMTKTMKTASQFDHESAPSRSIASSEDGLFYDVSRKLDDIDLDLDHRVQEQRGLLELAGQHVTWVIFLGTGFAISMLLVWRAFYKKEKEKFEGLSVLLSGKQSELVTAQSKAEIADQIKTEFLNNMSHEIRTPLNAIFGLGQLLKKTNMTADQSHYLEGIQGSSRSLLELVNGVLDFARIENQGIDIHLKPFRMEDLLKEVKFILQGQAELKKIELRVNFNAKNIAFVSDPVRLRQVLLNLAGNALKFTEKGFVEIRVSTPGPEKLKVEVIDTGVGIPKQAQDKIFQNFYQTDSSISRKYGGTGLGLAISKAIVKRFDGEIGFTSDAGKGSTFWFEISVQQASKEQMQDLIRAEVSAEMHSGEGFSGLKVLMIEDNSLNQVVLNGFLKSFGCEASIYNSGPAALQALRPMVEKNIKPIIFVDCQMPEMDGFQVTKFIREMEPKNASGKSLGHIWIVATTAHTSNGYREKCIAEGMDDFLAKPILPEELEKVLQRAKEFNSPGGTVTLPAMPPKSAPSAVPKLVQKQASPEPPKPLAKLDYKQWEKLNKVAAENGSFLQEIAKIFVASFPEKATELKQARDKENFEEIKDIAHFLKGSCANIGATEMCLICGDIEKWAGAKKSLILISAAIDHLLLEYDFVAPEIQNVAASGYSSKAA